MTAQIQRRQTDKGHDVLFDDLGLDLRSEFDEVERRRREYERLWLQDLRQYLGQYDPEVTSRLEPNQSRTFVPMTRKKVRMADARLRDLLFPAGRRGDNWSISPTEEPMLSADDEKRLQQQLMQQLARQVAESEGLEPRAVIQRMKTDDIPQDDLRRARQELAKQKAGRMQTTMSDQLGEMDYTDRAQRVLHSGHLYGIGVLKGPMPERRVVPRWEFDDQQGRWVRGVRVDNRPYAEFRPLWSLYPDMAASHVNDLRFMFEEHLFPKHQVLDLVKQHGFDAEKIAVYLEEHPNGDAAEKTHEQEIRTIHDSQAQTPDFKGYYRLLSREGFIDVNELVQAQLDTRENLDQRGFGARDAEGNAKLDENGEVRLIGEVFASIWMIGHMVVKAEVQPTYESLGDLYHLYYCEKGDGNLLDSQGWPRIIRDDQDMVNAATRAMLDNAAVTAGPQVEIETGLLQGQTSDFELLPFKPWWRNQHARDQRRNAITLHNVPNNTAQFGEIVALGERWLHEHSMPAFMEGQASPHSGNAQDTARGLSMLMSAANIELKDLARNFDEGVTSSFMGALYNFNMHWTPDDSIKGDFQIIARGSTALIAKEVQAQQTERFLAFMRSFPDWIKDEEIVDDIGDVTEHAEAVKSKAEHDRDMQNRPEPVERVEAAAKRLSAEADLEKARASRMEAEGYHAENVAQAVERITTAMTAVSDPDQVLAYAQQLGVDVNGDTGSEGEGAGDAASGRRDAGASRAGDVSQGGSRRRAPAS